MKIQQHTFQILTKRHTRIEEYITNDLVWSDNIWLGYHVVSMQQKNTRTCSYQKQKQIFLSIEPFIQSFKHRINWNELNSRWRKWK
jgi:protein gp37